MRMPSRVSRIKRLVHSKSTLPIRNSFGKKYNFDSYIFRKLYYKAVIVKSWSISARLIWRNEVWVFVIRFKFFQIPLLSSKTQTCSLTVPIVVYGKTPLDVRLLRNQEYKISISQHRKFTPGRNLLSRIQS